MITVLIKTKLYSKQQVVFYFFYEKIIIFIIFIILLFYHFIIFHDQTDPIWKKNGTHYLKFSENDTIYIRNNNNNIWSWLIITSKNKSFDMFIKTDPRPIIN